MGFEQSMSTQRSVAANTAFLIGANIIRKGFIAIFHDTCCPLSIDVASFGMFELGTLGRPRFVQLSFMDGLLVAFGYLLKGNEASAFKKKVQ